jgi:hypothetical protein
MTSGRCAAGCKQHMIAYVACHPAWMCAWMCGASVVHCTIAGPPYQC